MNFKPAAVILFVFIISCSNSPSDKIIFEKEPERAQIKAEQYLIKSAGGLYLSVLDSMVVARYNDPSKGTMFGKIDQGAGKIALLSSSGKFISDNRGNSSKVDAIRDLSSEWETFEIVQQDHNGFKLRSSSGKFICIDSGLVFANCEEELAEIFIFESK